MSFPSLFSDLSLWLAVTAIILLIASELLSPSYGTTSIRINIKRLKKAAVVVSILFLIAVAIRVINIILEP